MKKSILKEEENQDDSYDRGASAVVSSGIPLTEEGAEKTKEFVPSKGLTSAQAKIGLDKYGRNELPEKKKPKWLIFAEQLWQPMPIMIWIAAITEAGISNWPDMAILLTIQFVNAGLGYYEVTKAGDAVAALKKSLKPLATVKRDGKWSNIDAADLVPNDLVLLAAGSAIPADCLVNEGTIEVDQSALTADVTKLGQRGIRALAVARTDDNGQFRMLGLLTFLDPPRHDTKETIHRAVSYGVEVKMITGDHLLIAMETARMLDLGDRVVGREGVVPLIRGAEGLPSLDPETKKAPENLAKNYGDYIRKGHGFAQVFPEHKFLIVQCLRELGYKTGMTGDGVNDAPALKRADVGIAVAGATDAARAASDIVLTEEGLSTIIEGLIISRCIFQRMKNFITYRIAATLQLLIFFFIAVLALKPNDYMPSDWETKEGFGDEWPSYFKLPVLMLMLITMLNDGTLISVGYDNVTPSRYPNAWNLPVLFLVASVLALVALISSLILLYLCLDSWNSGSAMKGLGLGDLTYGQITTAMYLKVSISDFLTLFSARTHDGFFWSSMPSPILMGAALLSLFLSTILACFWPDSTVDGQTVEGLANHTPKELAVMIWIYCVFWWFVQDLAKVILYWWMEKYNIFGINDTLHLNTNLTDEETSANSPLLNDEERASASAYNH
eukprot:gene3610-2603_t